jgi:hypothetical protein
MGGDCTKHGRMKNAFYSEKLKGKLLRRPRCKWKDNINIGHGCGLD